MGHFRTIWPVKFFCGVLFSKDSQLREVCQNLSATFGDISEVSEAWPFTFTSYYEKEMGPDLRRVFILFKSLYFPEELIQWKRKTNEIEEQIKDKDRLRPVNLDPGYLDLGKLILASTKDHAHRLYLGSGVFGEVTLYAKQGRWETWPWTYPDYADPRYLTYFWKKREQYRLELKDYQKKNLLSSEKVDNFDSDSEGL